MSRLPKAKPHRFGFSGKRAIPQSAESPAHQPPSPNVTTTANKRGALTVAGQWRTFTAFPCILAIAVVCCAVALSGRNDVMEAISMTSTFIAGTMPTRQRQNFMLGSQSGLAAGVELERRQLPDLRRTSTAIEDGNGDPGKIRTSDTQFRKLLLYPPELRGHLL